MVDAVTSRVTDVTSSVVRVVPDYSGNVVALLAGCCWFSVAPGALRVVVRGAPCLFGRSSGPALFL